MLPRPHRLTRPGDFADVSRWGASAGCPTVVVRAVAGGEAPTRVGFVVGKRVGNAVIRNSVKRRLRHLAAAELPGVRTGYDVVVRALPGAADSRAALVSDFRRCWRAALNRADKRAMAR